MITSRINNQEILEKAIQKAIDGGWERGDKIHYNLVTAKPVAFSIIYRHDFAKALWGTYLANGELPRIPYFTESGNFELRQPQWKYHLQQMVIAEDPIKYLGDNL